jgi:nicotinate phosphoribosyltransferase
VAVEKRSANKRSHGGRKSVFRRLDAAGRAVADIVVPRPHGPLHTDAPESTRALLQPLVVDGVRQDDGGLDAARGRVQAARGELPREALQLSRGNAAIVAEFVASP